ncbi:hypothetical protein CDAR_201241 [Caerostris darwini]|uniref:Hairy/enhancer-of-split related with YRPW motif protein n=1 Tax=Caerostris darwini TaxID=1538125 RepID=A0AAV4P728_9ARAC|nr:hypothetical protein CDAR_201241 [Caerostris darwini]
MSDMDSECDDVFSEDSKGYELSEESKNSSVVDDDGRHIMNRKRRRGIIEKRRRDRINNSLSELRRLVPAAFEKQGSAKLEKAEILQMTVDHLRIMHSKGVDVFNFDPHSFAVDYHGVGFRECASEVARYLVGFEGLDLQDPLRLRLMSHLQCFSAQRDLAISSSPHQNSSPSPWFTTLPAMPTPQYPSFQARNSPRDLSMYSSSSSGTDRRPSSASSGLSSESSRLSPSRIRSHLPISPVALNASALIGNFGRTSMGLPESPAQRSPVKPYRPWGTEMAY